MQVVKFCLGTCIAITIYLDYLLECALFICRVLAPFPSLQVLLPTGAQVMRAGLMKAWMYPGRSQHSIAT